MCQECLLRGDVLPSCCQGTAAETSSMTERKTEQTAAHGTRTIMNVNMDSSFTGSVTPVRVQKNKRRCISWSSGVEPMHRQRRPIASEAAILLQ